MSARDICQAADVAICGGIAAIFAIFRSFSPLVEGVSIDEAYLDVTENYLNTPSATLVAMAIRKRIYDERGLDGVCRGKLQ